jgi:glyoxylase-like metal-dependent hydrolase (beta-lactamase superfamily II)
MEQIQLSNFSFEGDNNVYLFDDGPETVLVDSGDWMEDTQADLERKLDAYSTSFADVDRIFLTHWHGDHVGLAGTIQAESGCEVLIHEADAPLVRGDEDAWDALDVTQHEYFDNWGMPEEQQATLEDIFGSQPLREQTVDVTEIQDGDTFDVNGMKLEAIHAPGHAAGLSMYAFERDGESQVLTGDALLPQYTPNVGGADVRVEKPLAKYLDTLEGIVTAGYDRAWPGHRNAIEDPTARAETIIEHHEERAWRVLDALATLGPSDPWTVSAELFGDLESIHILHGPGEAYAHLEHLEDSSDVVREGREYRLADGVADGIEETETEHWPLRAD